MECALCTVPGWCPECDGYGDIPGTNDQCGTCHGTGKCPECAGTGEVRQ
jgi:RecJ-like exonuclease